jgi:hypothetical protein
MARALGEEDASMLHKLAFATIAAINFAVPTIAYTIEEDSQQPGERSHEHGANQDWNHLMQENEGYGLGDLVEPGMNYGEVMQVRKVMGTARRFAFYFSMVLTREAELP